jgi:hypothetical protein
MVLIRRRRSAAEGGGSKVVQVSRSTACDPEETSVEQFLVPICLTAKGAHNQTATRLEDGISRRTAAMASLKVGSLWIPCGGSDLELLGLGEIVRD